jgi:hypothetical protein
MQIPPRYSLVRRVLFPFSGEEVLSTRQSLRVIMAWAILFTVPMVLCTAVSAVLVAASFMKAVILLVGVVLGGVVIFGLSAWAVVAANNRSAYSRQQSKERDKTQ